MGEVSRRSVLQGGGVAMLLAALSQVDAFAASPKAPTRAKAKPGTSARAARRRLRASSVSYDGPFSVSSSCVLSEDYFLTDQVVMGAADDKVVPFARADGSVEALVLANNQVAHLARDASAVSGWSYTVLQPPLGATNSVTDVAVVTAGDGTVYAHLLLQAHGITLSQPGSLGANGTWQWSNQESSSPLPPGGLTPLRGGTDTNGVPYFATFMSGSSDPQFPTGTYFLWQPSISAWPSWNTSLAPLVSSAGGLDDAWLLWQSPTGADPTKSTLPHGAGVMLVCPNANGYFFFQNGYTSTGAGTYLIGAPWEYYAATGNELLWASIGSADRGPYLLIYDSSATDTNNISYFNGRSPLLGSAFNGHVDKVQAAAVWNPQSLGGGAESTAMALLANGTLNILSEVSSNGLSSSLTDPIPIEQGITSVTGLSSDPAHATLFVVYDDLTLSVLSKDPTTGAWSSVPVHQPSATVSEVSMWRVQLSVTDANGIPAANTQVMITPDQTIGIWQGSGNSILSPSAPLTTTTDSMGRVTFAYPAVELVTATLSVQVLQAGKPSGSPLTVKPDGDVHAFLAGTAPLNSLGTMSGATLTAATKPDGSPLFPKLAGLSGSTQSTAAHGVATAITQCMSAGLGAQPGSGEVQQWNLDMTGSTPTYSASPKIPPQSDVRRLRSFSSWWESVKHDVDSVFHAIVHGLIQVGSITAAWVKDAADDAYHWTVNLAIKIGDALEDVVSYVISDIRSAITAIGGILNTLGGYIDDAITWLRMYVGGFFKAVSGNAGTIDGWVSQGPAALNAQLKHVNSLADGYFHGLEASVKAELQQVADDLGDQSLATWLPSTYRSLASSEHAPKRAAKRRPKPHRFAAPPPPRLGSAESDISRVVHDIRSNWLLDKVLNFFDGEVQLASDAAVTSAFSAVIDSAENDGKALVSSLTTLAMNIVETCVKPGGLVNLPFATLVGWLGDLVEDLLVFADDVIDLLFQLVEAVVASIGNLLDHDTMSFIPVVGGLLSHFGIDDHLTASKLFSYLAAFPATLWNEIENPGQPLFPGGASVGAAHGLRAGGDWADGLAYTAATVQFFWGIWDIGVDGYAITEEDPPMFLAWGDVCFNTIMQCLQWPGVDPDGSVGIPFANQPPTASVDDRLNLAAWLLSWSDTVLCDALAQADLQKVEGQPNRWSLAFTLALSALAIGDMVVSCIYAWRTNGNGAAKANAIMSNLADSLEIFVSEEIAGATEESSYLFKLAADLIANWGAAVTDVTGMG